MSARQPGARRRLDASVPPEYDRPTRAPRFSGGLARSLAPRVLAVAWVLATVVAATSVVAIDLPGWVWRPASAVLLVVTMVVLTVRVGGRLRIWGPFALVIAAGGLTGINLLVVIAATLSGVLSSVLAVMLTRPAATLPRVLGEFGVSLTLALSGAFAVAAWNAPVAVYLYIPLVVAGTVAVTVTIVWSLGASLHGLSRQYQWALAAAFLVVVVIFVYGSVLRVYGSPGLTNWIKDFADAMYRSVGGVLHPFEVLVGFPAIVVGVSLRSRYREGWWVTALGTLGSSVLTTGLVDPGALPSYVLLSTVYSAIAGAAIGLVVRRIVLAPRSARAARAVQPPSRAEPGRFDALR